MRLLFVLRLFLLLVKHLFPLHRLFDVEICVCVFVCVCVPVISRNDVVLSHRLGFRLLLQLALDGADVVLQHLGKDDIVSSGQQTFCQEDVLSGPP